MKIFTPLVFLFRRSPLPPLAKSVYAKNGNFTWSVVRKCLGAPWPFLTPQGSKGVGKELEGGHALNAPTAIEEQSPRKHSMLTLSFSSKCLKISQASIKLCLFVNFSAHCSWCFIGSCKCLWSNLWDLALVLGISRFIFLLFLFLLLVVKLNTNNKFTNTSNSFIKTVDWIWLSRFLLFYSSHLILCVKLPLETSFLATISFWKWDWFLTLVLILVKFWCICLFKSRLLDFLCVILKFLC